MPKTICEKILSARSHRSVQAGDVVAVYIDFFFMHDGNFARAYDAFQRSGAEEIFDRNRLTLVIDHHYPSPREKASNVQKAMIDLALEKGIRLYDGEGICHQLVPEKGHVKPGDVVVGNDSHTITYGALNAFATGLGPTDIGIIMATGQTWMRVPQTIRIHLKGRPQDGVSAKDIILHIIGDLGVEGAPYRAIEFTGDGMKHLSMDARFTLSNMAVEMEAKCGIVAADTVTLDWLAQHCPDGSFSSVNSDEGASYEATHAYDISVLEPQVAAPHMVDNVTPVGRVAGTDIAQGFIGTCTNARLEDLRIADRILAGKTIKPGVRLLINPASKAVLTDAMNEGIVQRLIQAGATMLWPGCGICDGAHSGVPWDGANVISSGNRNFKGRMGNNKAFVYLASPATVAASVLTGVITDPREML
jgi:3-isopropylmalate/(R)-2-methylmalate dehydratase large subunit